MPVEVGPPQHDIAGAEAVTASLECPDRLAEELLG